MPQLLVDTGPAPVNKASTKAAKSATGQASRASAQRGRLSIRPAGTTAPPAPCGG